MVDPEAMEAAMAEEAFLQGKEEEKTKVNGRRVTDTDLGEMTLTEMAMVTATTTRDEQGEDPQHRDATFTMTERCSPGAGREKEKR